MKSIGRFKSEEHRNTRAVLIGYKFMRRRGMARQEALASAIARHNRLSGAAAVMEASGWNADPILVVLQAHFADKSLAAAA